MKSQINKQTELRIYGLLVCPDGTSRPKAKLKWCPIKNSFVKY